MPEDFSRSSTIDIVESIRCEAQAAIWSHAQKASLKDGGANARDYRPLPKFRKAVIGYEFQFTITEQNNKDSSASFALPFQEGRFSFGITANKDLKRESDRNFKFVETFEDVIAANCARGPREKNFKYPITGEIGLAEVVETFIRLEQLTSLSDGAVKFGTRVATFSDKLIFTTAFGGNVSANLDMNAGPLNSLRLAKASAGIAADRSDVHKVTIALAVDTPRGETSLPRSLVPESAMIESARQQPTTARDRVLFELDRQRLLENDERILDLVR